jgi:hypothetical protein
MTRPPPKDTQCDAYTNWHPDPVGQPVVTRCPNKATVTIPNTPPLNTDGWFCQPCAASLKAKGHE